jgi:endonuclease YncB( thermonuclease family)
MNASGHPVNAGIGIYPASRCRAAPAFFNPPDPGVTSGEFEFVQRVVDGDTLLLVTGERVRLIGVNTPETVHRQKPRRGIRQRSLRRFRSAWRKANWPG